MNQSLKETLESAEDTLKKVDNRLKEELNTTQ